MEKKLPENLAAKTGAEGLEPSLTVLETGILPLEDTPVSEL
jgi:hypothetical protein